MAETLRVGILCDGTTFQEWQAESIRQLLAVPGVELVALVEREPIAIGKAPVLKRILRYPWPIALYLHYRRHRFKPAAARPVDMSAELAQVPHLRCTVEKRGHGEYFADADLDTLRQLRVDVLLRFGFNILRGDILALPRYGVWSFHHGDEQKYRGGPPGFWEILNGEPVTGAILQRLTEKLDAGIVLRKGWFKTLDHSLVENVDNVLRHSAPWPAEVARELLAGRMQVLDAPPSGTKARIRTYPTNSEFMRFLKVQGAARSRSGHTGPARREEWNFGVLYQPITTLLDERPSLNVRWLPSPGKEAYRSTPFGYMVNGELNVLYEKYDIRQQRGEISRLRPKRDNVLKRSRTMLDADTHLSYPYVIEHEGMVYCIPENASAGKVELYRVDSENYELEHVRMLLHEHVYSPTVFAHEGRWWLFGTKDPLADAALHAYHSERFEGPYTPHSQNPIKVDVRSARPGGTPFRRGEELWRPAQDRSQDDGGRIALNRITELTPTSFSEETVKFLGPTKGQYPLGMRTLCAVGDMTLVDGKRIALAKPKDHLSRTPSRKREIREDDEDDDA